MLKPVDELSLPDPRIATTAGRTGLAPITLLEQHDWVEAIRLGPDTPQAVVEGFDRARNAFIYAYYVYEFLMLAELQALATVEMALRLRLGPRAHHKDTLANLVQKAVKDGHLSNPPPPNPDLATILTMMRNDLAHGSDHVHLPSMTITLLEMCADKIRLLFP